MYHGLWIFSGVQRRDWNLGPPYSKPKLYCWSHAASCFNEFNFNLLVLRSNNISVFQESCQYTIICIFHLRQPFSSPKRRHWYTRILTQLAM